MTTSEEYPPPEGEMPPGQAVRSSGQHPWSFFTQEGRQRFYNEWLRRQLDEGTIDPQKRYTPEERSAFFSDWLRTLIAQGQLDPRRRLPPYRSLADLAFNVKEKAIARVIAQLRSEGLLPPRKARSDKGQTQWTDRDLACLRWIGQMRAIRFDQLQRLLARYSTHETSDPHRLSVASTTQILHRWVRAGHAHYRRLYIKQSGWIYLSNKGLAQAGLSYRAEAPKERVLEHLYAINEVRLALEEQDPLLQWIGERALQAEQQRRQKGQRLQHIPDGIVVSGARQIDIEVQISHPLQEEVEQVLRGDVYQNTNALRYYVSQQAKAVVQRAHRAVQETGRSHRPQIEIIELDAFLQASTKGAYR